MTFPNRNWSAPVEQCRSCGAREVATLLSLGAQPASDLFPHPDDHGPDPKWPLGLAVCQRCSLAQLTHRSPAPLAPLAAESSTMMAHAVAAAGRVVAELSVPQGSSVRSFDSHHGGSWLPALTDLGLNVVSGEADLVVDNHALIHEEDFDAALAKRIAAVATRGALVIEFHHHLEQVEQVQFDTIRHGHPVYLSVTSWANALARHGFGLVDAWTQAVFGGSVIAVARRGQYRPSARVESLLERERAAGLSEPTRLHRFSRESLEAALALNQYLIDARSEGRQVLGYGAPSKAAVLLGVARVDHDLLAVTADRSPDKWGRRIPGTSVTICSPEALVGARPDEVLVLTWDILPEVRNQLHVLESAGTGFVIPFPRAHRVD